MLCHLFPPFSAHPAAAGRSCSATPSATCSYQPPKPQLLLPRCSHATRMASPVDSLGHARGNLTTSGRTSATADDLEAEINQPRAAGSTEDAGDASDWVIHSAAIPLGSGLNAVSIYPSPARSGLRPSAGLEISRAGSAFRHPKVLLCRIVTGLTGCDGLFQPETVFRAGLAQNFG